MTLLNECLSALGKHKKILTRDETELILKSFMSSFLFTEWGAIDWSTIENKYTVTRAEDLKAIITKQKSNYDENVYILWNDYELPCISVGLQDALDVIDDVTTVSFDTWIYNKDKLYIIEFHHEGRVTIGFL